MTGNLSKMAVSLTLSGVLAGCSGSQTPEAAKTETPPAQTQAPAPAEPAPTAQAPAPAATPDQATTAPADSTAPPVAAVASFTDIKGLSCEQAVKDLAALEVLDSNGPEFKPFEPITRAEYVRWVMKANNKIAGDTAAYQLRLAETPDATFVDVKPADPDFKYIQGLANAGFVVGIDKDHFAPNRPLTREEMVMIKAQMDEGGELKTRPDYDIRFVYFSDKDAINPDYIGAMYHDSCATTTKNTERVWGTIKKFQPKKPVLRSEAAISVSQTRAGKAREAVEKQSSG